MQFVNPQTFCDSVWHLCDTTQELFGSFVGANTFVMSDSLIACFCYSLVGLSLGCYTFHRV